jgi:hypothetical protein
LPYEPTEFLLPQPLHSAAIGFSEAANRQLHLPTQPVKFALPSTTLVVWQKTKGQQLSDS